jgi:uncharacterized protein (DUF2164 family)
MKNDMEGRRGDYIKSVESFIRYGEYFDRIFVLECIETEGVEYLKLDDKVEVVYSRLGNFYHNKGINEILHIRDFLKRREDIGMEDMVVKATGRYTLEGDDFLKGLDMDYDIIAKDESDIWPSDSGVSRGVHTFYIAYKKKTVFDILDFIDVEMNPLFSVRYNIEWHIKDYMKGRSNCLFYEGRMGILTNFGPNHLGICRVST